MHQLPGYGTCRYETPLKISAYQSPCCLMSFWLVVLGPCCSRPVQRCMWRWYHSKVQAASSCMRATSAVQDCVGAWSNDTPPPAWCLAPFEPSGLLRLVNSSSAITTLHHTPLRYTTLQCSAVLFLMCTRSFWCGPPRPCAPLACSTIGGTMSAFLGLHFGHVLAQCEVRRWCPGGTCAFALHRLQGTPLACAWGLAHVTLRVHPRCAHRLLSSTS